MFCHGELARLKPDPADGLAFFYFMVALGGACGAAFVSLFAPNVFHTFLELPVGVAACFILSLPLLYRRGSPRQLLRVSFVAAAAFAFVNIYGAGMQSALRIRNFYGALQVTESGTGDDSIRSLYNGKVLHGVQYLAGAKSRIATAYYAPETGIGLVMRWLRQRCPWRVAIVGLGTGTLAVYGRPGDSYRFFDINPAVIAIAWRDFRYLRESAANIKTVAVDGRLGLAREPAHSLNLIALDAFSGDSIPVHLLTREAFADVFRPPGAGRSDRDSHHEYLFGYRIRGSRRCGKPGKTGVRDPQRQRPGPRRPGRPIGRFWRTGATIWRPSNPSRQTSPRGTSPRGPTITAIYSRSSSNPEVRQHNDRGLIPSRDRKGAEASPARDALS